MNKLKLEVESLTDKGLIKEINQDCFLVQIGEAFGNEFGLFIICDGVGGLEFGELASLTCIKLYKEWWKKEVANILREEKENVILNEINKVLLKANNEIKQMSELKNSKMGTTASVILIKNNKYYIAHIGDSRIYKYFKNKVIQLTEDQSLVNLQVKRGEITKEQAKVSKQRNILLQCVGVKDKIDIYNYNGILTGKESFLLCSDGFYSKLDEKELNKLSRKFRKRKDNRLQILNEYIDIVKERRESDNITIMLVNCIKEKFNFKSFFINR